ncbi:MAG: hypothetical protein LBE35_01245 [Clostridiales bacterium]|nr:hypothetical protein [Clostridiales bacterium]
MNIDANYIENLLKEAKGERDIAGILDKAEKLIPLTDAEVAALLMCEDEEQNGRIFEIAGRVKDRIYGNRVVMFAPLYVSDYCVNECVYCNYNCNHKFARRRLTMDEIRKEVLVLEKMGHKRLALEAGEDPENCPIVDYPQRVTYLNHHLLSIKGEYHNH